MAQERIVDVTLAQIQKQLQNSQINKAVLIQGAVSTTGASSAAPPPQANNKESETKDMSNQTEERRKRGTNMRWCDLRVGDKVTYIGPTQTMEGVVEVGQGADSYHLNWMGTGLHTSHRPISDTTTLKNVYSSEKAELTFDPMANSVAGAKPITFKGVDWDSVILAADKKDQIEAAISQVDNHDLIFNQWGFAEIFEKGTAISLLFYGPPGTGKTLMAQAVADRYNKKLTIIGSAEVQTPEPGGAERNLKQYFGEAQREGDVLLFDECDSLITDRSRVGMIVAGQINALLSELEKYTGIVVFTTNRLGALDPAFDRRLSLKLEFPMPDAKHRLKIWKRMFPKQCPLDPDIRWADLASIEIAGGHIKNVVLKAARLAAAGKAKAITDDFIWESLEKEIESMGSMTEALDEYNPWYGTQVKGGTGAMDVIRERGRNMIRGQ